MKQQNDYLLDLQKKANLSYDRGFPIMDDSTYDALFGDTGGIGAPTGDIPHTIPMYSLQKHYKEDGEPPFPNNGNLVETPKLDGAAVSLLYKSGVLVQALTRGDGKLGRSIIDKAIALDSVVTQLMMPYDCQIIGEMVASKNVSNSRNAASGSLGLKNLEEFQARAEEIDLTFVAYGVSFLDGQSVEDNLKSNYAADLDMLQDEGFLTVMSEDPILSIFPTDGKVLRVNNNRMFANMGYTAKHPRGAYASKQKQKPVSTMLLGVSWQTGKSGKVTPVAILEPIVIGEATISRATLNNMAYIEGLGLEIGCLVEVIRSGEIIPCIVGRAD